MRRLIYTVIFTGRFEEMKAFYGRKVGLKPAAPEHEDWVEYDTGSARIALHRMADPERHGMVLRFETDEIDAEVAALAAHGIRFTGAPRDYPWGRLAEFHDPEGNFIGLQQSRDGGRAPAVEVDRVVLNCTRFVESAHFYRERVGLKLTVDSEHWVEFDTGETRLALHPRRRDVDHPPHTEQAVTIVLGSRDLMAWVETMRSRDVLFATAPIEEDFGLYAEAADPDGYMVVFREPPPPPSLEEELAEAFEEGDDTPHQVAIRKPPQKPSRASGLIAGLQRRSRREAEELRREREAVRAARVAAEPRGLDVVAPRGSGVAGSRQKPKTQTDPKRAKAKPAIGSLKEGVRQVMETKQRAVARKSKAAPLKGKAKRRRQAASSTAKKTALQRVMKATPQKGAVKKALKRAVKRAVSRTPKRAAKRAQKRVVRRSGRR